MIISTSDKRIQTYLNDIVVPQASSHKGQNGKALVIGGSSLFHGAVLWSAEAISHIVDMVHVASTQENNEIIQKIKVAWQTGIVISQKDILAYVQEDSVILIGNGMMRGEDKQQLNSKIVQKSWDEICLVHDEGQFTREVVYYLLFHFPDKQFVLDAGALQMMDRDWLRLPHKRVVITPHQKEFQTLFGVDISTMSIEKKEEVVFQMAQTYSCIVLLKAVDDIVSDGHTTVRITGGNAGLTKGGTGDILAGLVTGMSATSNPFSSAVVSSFLLKKTAEELFLTKGSWYTPKDILTIFPEVFQKLRQIQA